MIILNIRGELRRGKMSARSKLAKAFSLNLLSGTSKIPVSSGSSFSEVKVLLGEGTAQSQRKLVSAFLWLDRKTQGRTRVEDEAGFQVCQAKLLVASRDPKDARIPCPPTPER